MEPATLWVDDTHPILRRGMVACLTGDGFRIIGESAGLRPVPAIDEVQLLIFEASASSLREVVRLTDGGSTKLVATVRDSQVAEVPCLIDAGVRAIMLRDTLSADLLCSTLRTVAAGATSVPAEMMLRALTQVKITALAGTGVLTDREREVLRWLADGSGTLEIAEGLSFSERTVKNVVHDILMKLNCRTRAHAVAMATRSGVI